jgi:opacity protein-like surface antigen
MKTLLLSTATALIMASGVMASDASAQAIDGQFNLGAGYTYLDLDGTAYDALTLRGGYDFNEYFGVEGEALIGLGEESETVLGINVDSSLNYGLGVYAKGQYPITDAVSVHGRVGYVWAEVEASAAGLSVSDDEDGVGYGVGAQYAFNGLNAVRADYTLYDFGNDADADGWSVSYVRRF